MKTVVAVSLAWLVSLALAVLCEAHAAERNVVLIISDDQGRDLGAYGNTSLKTPHLDALAADGTLFTHAFSTVSSCSPSRAVIFTGLYSHTNGMYGLAHDVHNQHLLPSVRTLPQFLKDIGYATALVGKKHILPDDALPFDDELAPEQPGNRDVAFMVDQARAFILKNEKRPFLLVMGFSDPHRAAENFGNTRTWPSVARVTYDPAKIDLPSHLPDVPEVRQDIAQYYESVSRLDDGVGLLLDMLRASGHLDDTLIIYLSDNGRPFPGAKTTLYDEGIRLPLIIRSPNQKRRAVRSSAMVSWIDIVPTIVAWTGAKPGLPAPLPGRSLLPLLEATETKGWDVIFASHGFHEIHQYYPMRALRTRDYKYILNLASELPFPIAGDIASSPSWQAIEKNGSRALGRRSVNAFLHRPREELYDLGQDSQEVSNKAADPEYREILERMRKQLTEHRVATHDPWLPGQSSVFGPH